MRITCASRPSSTSGRRRRRTSTTTFRWARCRRPWKETRNYSTPIYYTTTVASEAGIPLPAPGVNKAADLYLSEGYALPEAECWGILILSGCGISTVKGTAQYSFGDRVKFDVLPNNLDDFYKLQAIQGGSRLAWDGLFPPLHDADGDGLAYSADPNDSAWDTDGDGLSDQYEVETGTDAAVKDTDKDGLTDAQEAQLGSDPNVPDSDGDGMYDCLETFHEVIEPDQLGATAGAVCGAAGAWKGGWDFVYGLDAGGKQLITRLGSVPSDPDEDADSYLDSQEKTYGFHPGVPSQSEILTLDSEITESGAGGLQEPGDNYVKPGETLQYTATVKNELDAREAEGLLWTEGSTVLDRGDIQPQSFVLMPKGATSATGDLGVASNAASGVYSLTQVAGALITDWRELSGNADQWLRFDEAVGATTYADTSGNVPPNDGACTGSATVCTIVAAGGKFGNAIQLNGQGYVKSAVQVPTAAYALSLWFKTSTNGDQSLFAAETLSGGDTELDVGIHVPSGSSSWQLCGSIRTATSCDKNGCYSSYDQRARRTATPMGRGTTSYTPMARVRATAASGCTSTACSRRRARPADWRPAATAPSASAARRAS